MCDETPGELNDFERALAGLMPAAVESLRDATIFAAGRAAARRGVWRWRGACGALALAWLGAAAVAHWPVAVLPADRGQTGTNLVATAAEVALPPIIAPVLAPEMRALPTDSYWRLRALVLARGVDALPADQADGFSSTPPWRADDAAQFINKL